MNRYMIIIDCEKEMELKELSKLMEGHKIKGFLDISSGGKHDLSMSPLKDVWR